MNHVSDCPHCGAPVYQAEWDRNGDPPACKYSCTCRYGHQGAPWWLQSIQPITVPPLTPPITIGDPLVRSTIEMFVAEGCRTTNRGLVRADMVGGTVGQS